MTDLSAIEIDSSLQPSKGSVIWLHGLGADGNDFAPIVPELALPQVRFIFPHAPYRPITINQGYEMRAWFDVSEFRLDAPLDEKGMQDSVALVHHFIQQEKAKGIATDKIVLAGFSQGGVIALKSALTYPEKMGGALCLSTYLPQPDQFSKQLSEANRHTPIFLAHGTEDTVLPYPLGLMAQDFLLRHQYPLEWKSYRMGHSVCEQEIRDISAWLKARF